MKLWMYQLDDHNPMVTGGFECIVGVVQAETYDEAECKITDMMNDYQTIGDLHEIDFDNPDSTKYGL